MGRRASQYAGFEIETPVERDALGGYLKIVCFASLLAIMQKTTVIAGLEVYTHTTDAFADSTKPIYAVFFLHGRMGSAQSDYMQKITAEILSSPAARSESKDLMIVTFDHRNHGTRLKDRLYNLSFEENPNHALDMYTIQLGTAKDVSFLIDFLPSYLFPLGERTISDWGVTGISLGGHSAYIAGASDPRLKLTIPIIGCPDYLALMYPRAKEAGLNAGPPYLPDSFVEQVKRDSLLSLPYTSEGPENPFYGKHVLVLSGGADPLVPWTASKPFVEGLQVGPGSKEFIVFDGVGHDVPPPMVAALIKSLVSFVNV
ncbi:unnamed protein product [Mycena citricolor]|uniref:AB hydrolase-1 domain-containing protein n=1 Tax=Mycena citricolor TaxID=2018698 RepID=A0AAD2H771_9AGAR|nr:unnamed protein product [Mycena citricolor]